MKKVLLVAFGALLLVGCSESEEAEPKKDDKVEQVVEEEEVKETVKEEIGEEDVEVKEEIVKEEPPVITFVEFDKTHARDPESEVYMNGLFELKSGERVNADYVWYVDGGFFDYASAIFIDGNLASLKIESTQTFEVIEKGLGISLENVNVDATRMGYEIVFDERFHTDNIRVYPNEWN